MKGERLENKQLSEGRAAGERTESRGCSLVTDGVGPVHIQGGAASSTRGVTPPTHPATDTTESEVLQNILATLSNATPAAKETGLHPSIDGAVINCTLGQKPQAHNHTELCYVLAVEIDLCAVRIPNAFSLAQDQGCCQKVLWKPLTLLL